MVMFNLKELSIISIRKPKFTPENQCKTIILRKGTSTNYLKLSTLIYLLR